MSNTTTGPKRSASKPRVQEAPSLAAQEDHVVPPPEWDMEDDGTVPPEVLAALRDPNWTSDDLKDMRTNVVITTDIEAAIAAYEEEAQRWRVEREAAKNYRAAHRPANEDVPSASKSLAALCSREAMRSKTINNPKATFTFTTLVNACLNPEVQALGPDAIAESMVQVKNVKLDSVGLEDTDVLECLEVVQTLNLSNNLIRRLDGLEILTHLRVLIIPDNFVESLLPIAALELEMLDARRNRISTIEEDGVGVLPLTLKRCFLEGNPCTDVAGYVDLARQSCALLEVLDDDFFEPEERNDADDNEEDAATPAAAADDDGVANDNMDFDIEEEEARTAAFLAQQRRGGTQRPTSARYSLPVSDGVSSSVRTATDDLLRRYETELKTKLQSINRANDLAIAGLGSAGVAPAGDDAERSSRPSSRHARSDIASSRNAPSTLAEAVAYAAQRQHHPSGLLDSPRAASMPGTEPDAFEAGGAGSDSDEDNDMDDDMETGFNSHASASRPHAQAATRQTELQRELRFAMEHQRNVAINELNDRWDTGVDQLRRLRDVQEARHRSEEIREASAPAAGSAYNRAIEFLKGYSGERNLDKYRVARPGGQQ